MKYLLLAAFLGLPGLALADDMPREMFAQLVIGDGKEQSKFIWPKEERFEQFWRSNAEVIRVLEVDAVIFARDEKHTIDRLLLAAWPTADGYRLMPMGAKVIDQLRLAKNLLYSRVDWTLKSGALDGASKELRFANGDASIDARVRYLSPKLAPSKDGWTAWSYAATLLASDPPINEEFQPPMGRCSMDTAPQEESAKYADDCYAKGRLGCYLQLQVRIMGDHFARVASSSYGEEAHGTEVARLERAGIEAERFVVGLSYQFARPGERDREELWPWRLARAMNESAHAEKFDRALVSIIGDAGVDEYNRLRATQTLAYRKLRLQGDAPRPQAIKAELAKLPLSPASRLWLSTYLFDD